VQSRAALRKCCSSAGARRQRYHVVTAVLALPQANACNLTCPYTAAYAQQLPAQQPSCEALTTICCTNTLPPSRCHCMPHLPVHELLFAHNRQCINLVMQRHPPSALLAPPPPAPRVCSHCMHSPVHKLLCTHNSCQSSNLLVATCCQDATQLRFTQVQLPGVSINHLVAAAAAAAAASNSIICRLTNALGGVQ
jgi:hypothetical protein